MEGLDLDTLETEHLEDLILAMFEGRRDFIIMSALTMVTAKVIVSQKKNIPSLDLEQVLSMADEQLRDTVYGVLEMMRRNKNNN